MSRFYPPGRNNSPPRYSRRFSVKAPLTVNDHYKLNYSIDGDLNRLARWVVGGNMKGTQVFHSAPCNLKAEIKCFVVWIFVRSFYFLFNELKVTPLNSSKTQPKLQQINPRPLSGTGPFALDNNDVFLSLFWSSYVNSNC